MWDSHPIFPSLCHSSILVLPLIPYLLILSLTISEILFSLGAYTPGLASLAVLFQTLEQALFTHPYGLIGLYETYSL